MPYPATYERRASSSSSSVYSTYQPSNSASASTYTRGNSIGSRSSSYGGNSTSHLQQLQQHSSPSSPSLRYSDIASDTSPTSTASGINSTSNQYHHNKSITSHASNNNFHLSSDSSKRFSLRRQSLAINTNTTHTTTTPQPTPIPVRPAPPPAAAALASPANPPPQQAHNNHHHHHTHHLHRHGGSTSSVLTPISPSASAARKLTYSSLVSNPTPPAPRPSVIPTTNSNTIFNSLNTTTTVKKRNSVKTKEKRLSIFPWSNRKSSSSGPTHNNYYNSGHVPVISDPVLEFSTADFFTSSDAPPSKATRAVPVITTYPPSQHAINTRNSVIGITGVGTGGASDFRVNSPTSSVYSKGPPRRPNSISYAASSLSGPKTPIMPLMEEQTQESMTTQIDDDLDPRRVRSFRSSHGPLSPLVTQMESAEGHFKQQSVSTIDESTQTAAAVPMDNPVVLRKMLRESEQKVINVMIEYQQKVENSEQRVVELEKKLSEQIAETYAATAAAAATAATGLSSPADSEGLLAAPGYLKRNNSPLGSNPLDSPLSSPTTNGDKPINMSAPQMQVRITSLEAQREHLREALKALRTTKDLEISQYRNQVARLTRMNALQRSLQGDPFLRLRGAAGDQQLVGSGPSSPSSQKTTTPTNNKHHHRHHSHGPSYSTNSAAYFLSSSEMSSATKDDTDINAMMVEPVQAVQQSTAPALISSAAPSTKSRNPSLDFCDSSYTSPMSVSSTRTIHSVSSSSSTSSASSTGSLNNYYSTSSGNGNGPVYQQITTDQQQQQQSNNLPRRIGVGPFLPMGKFKDQELHQQQQQVRKQWRVPKYQ